MKNILKVYILISLLISFSHTQTMSVLFYGVDSEVSNAVEIAAQGDHVYILRFNGSSNSLYKFDGTSFVLVDSPPSKELMKITVNENGELYACTTTNELWTNSPLSSPVIWSIVNIGSLKCADVAIGYGLASRLFMSNKLEQQGPSNAANYKVYWWRYKLSGVWDDMSQYGATLSSSDNGQLVSILNNNGIYKYFLKLNAGSINPFDLNSTSDPLANDKVSISSQTNDIIWIVYNGIIYKIDKTCSSLTTCYNISSSLNAKRISAPWNNLPWIISNTGLVYKGKCAVDYLYDQKTLLCVSTCPDYATADISNQLCKYDQMFKFIRKDTSVTNAKEIEAQGNYVFILKTDNKLYKWNGTTFDIITSQPPILLNKITVTERGLVYACTVDELLYTYDDPTNTWGTILLTGGAGWNKCSNIAIGYGPRTSLMRLDSGLSSGTEGNKNFMALKLNNNIKWYQLSQFSALALNDEGQAYFILNDGNNFSLFFGKDITTSLKFQLNDLQPNTAVTNDDIDISNPTGNVVMFVYQGVLYRNDDTLNATNISGCVKLDNKLNLKRVSAPRLGTPWVIDVNGKVYQAECNAPYNYWDQKDQTCKKLSSECNTNTQVVGTTCMLYPMFGFARMDTTMTSALEIDSQETYTIILTTANELMLWDSSQLKFNLFPSPTNKVIKSVTINEKGVIYACDSNYNLWKGDATNTSTGNWTQISLLAANLKCFKVSIGYGPFSRLYMLHYDTTRCINGGADCMYSNLLF